MPKQFRTQELDKPTTSFFKKDLLILIVGSVTFSLMNDSTNAALTSIIQAAPLLKKIRIHLAYDGRSCCCLCGLSCSV
ncbi:hypothetical protein KPC83_03040 [Collinsella sp. zg1085]|uniref:hypothetical protein n=1 Tax=Collinsella sp. zg1085 TaxID=2844380 RepID=UPI001C0D22C8|nr:hypothetical protein [Collinsella sp. zg1085]QWT18121.1 hypothetical protein KPC83_03040 [Collinsella sp. zg1085]